ncbi:MAG: C40 family peptidase [Prochlorococcaceae cyanobacterium]
MATLSILEPDVPAAAELLLPGSVWQLQGPIDCYSRPGGPALATQASVGRRLEILASPAWSGGHGRLRARLLEDGYPFWLEPAALLGQARSAAPWRPPSLASSSIAARISRVLAFALAAAERPNRYLWGGTLGPNFDCSGLLQSAFAAAGIWIPRDAYQQERFCQALAVRPGQWQLLRPGDLIFFGLPQRCSHVAIHLGEGRYLHSSGQAHGRDGIGIDSLSPHSSEPVSEHYRRQLRGAGRVMRCHDGTTLA